MKEGDIVKNTGHDAKGTEGFDYQFLYFINRLLKMVEKRDVVSYENMMMYPCSQENPLFTIS